MSAIRPFDLAALRDRRLETILVDLAAGTLELRFADHVEIWQRIDLAGAAVAGRALRSFNGEAYIGPRDAHL